MLTVCLLFINRILFSSNLFHKDDDSYVAIEESSFKEIKVNIDDSTFRKICAVVSRPVFLFTSLTLSVLNFISSVLLHWTVNYSINVLKSKLDMIVVTNIISLSSPLIGMLFGGIIVQKYAGGYEGKNSIIFALVFCILAFIFIIPIRYINTIDNFNICLCGIYFFGGCAYPILQGIMISSLQNQSKAVGYSVSNIIQMSLGLIPGPIFYSFINQLSKAFDEKAAMTIVLYYSLVGIGFCCIALYYRNYKKTTELNKSNSYEIVSLISTKYLI